MKHKCLICGLEFKDSKNYAAGKNLFAHVKRTHKLNRVEYVKKYIHKQFKFESCGWCNDNAVPIVIHDKSLGFLLKYEKYLCDDIECKMVRKKYNPRSYYATMKTKKITEYEAKKLVSSKSPFHKEYFESKDEYLKFQNNTSLESMIKKHGDVEGNKKFKRFSDERKKSISEEYYIEKYGEIKGKKKWKENCSSKAITLDNMKKLHGDKANEIYEGWKSKIVNTLENFIKRHGEIKGIDKYKEYVEKHKVSLFDRWVLEYGKENAELKWNEYIKSISMNLETFQRKYGKEEGLQRYINWNNARFDFKKGKFVSGISIEFFDKLNEQYDYNMIYGDPEPWVKTLAKPLKVDCLIEKINTVIEFYGDFYHCNPMKYKGRDKYRKSKNIHEIWKSDSKRQCETLTGVDYLLVIWEGSYKNNKESSIITALDYLQKFKEGNIPYGCYEI